MMYVCMYIHIEILEMYAKNKRVKEYLHIFFLGHKFAAYRFSRLYNSHTNSMYITNNVELD